MFPRTISARIYSILDKFLGFAKLTDRRPNLLLAIS